MTALGAAGPGGEGIRQRLQRLPGPTRVLAVGALAELTSPDKVFTTSEVNTLMRELRLPAVANTSSVLTRLKGQDLVMRPVADCWALTPLGHKRLEEEAERVPVDGLALELGQEAGSELGERTQTLIPPFLGPLAAAPGLARLLGDAPFERNVMLITRFPRSPEDHYSELIPELREAVAEHGLALQVASDGMAEDELWPNINTYMWACKYAIVLMDTDDGRLNYNVLIEVGGMLMTGRRCAILRDESVEAMPSDMVGHIYKPTDLSDHRAAVAEIHKWIRDDLRLGACDDCPVPPRTNAAGASG